MFIGDFEKSAPWSTASLRGCRRFIERIWALQDVLTQEEGGSAELESLLHKTIKKVTEDIESLKFNTAIAAMMTFLNAVGDQKRITRGEMRVLLLLLNPFVPHITEELWEKCGFQGMVTGQQWPDYDPEKCKDAVVEIAVQVGGKIKTRLSIPADLEESRVLEQAKADEKVAPLLAGKTLVKEIYIKGKLVNLVVK